MTETTRSWTKLSQPSANADGHADQGREPDQVHRDHHRPLAAELDPWAERQRHHRPHRQPRRCQRRHLGRPGVQHQDRDQRETHRTRARCRPCSPHTPPRAIRTAAPTTVWLPSQQPLAVSLELTSKIMSSGRPANQNDWASPLSHNAGRWASTCSANGTAAPPEDQPQPRRRMKGAHQEVHRGHSAQRRCIRRGRAHHRHLPAAQNAGQQRHDGEGRRSREA